VSNASRRGDAAEERAAKLLGVKRVGGKRKKDRVPDTEPVRLSSGRLLQPEVKYRAALPKLLTGALGQAKRYAPTAEPVVFLYARGNPKGIAILDAALFAEIAGIREPVAASAQLSLALTVPEGKKPVRGA